MTCRIIPARTWVVVTPPRFYLESQKYATEQPRYYYTTQPVLLPALLDAQVAKATQSSIEFPNLAEALASGLRGKALDVSTAGEVSFDGVST